MEKLEIKKKNINIIKNIPGDGKEATTRGNGNITGSDQLSAGCSHNPVNLCLSKKVQDF